MSRWFTTARASGPALPFAAVMAGFALLVSGAGLSLVTTAALLPLALLLGFIAARIQRGSPVTLRGIRASAREEGVVSASRLPQPRFLLVAMPVNHYGEKLRWLMDLLGAPYEEATVGGLLSALLRGRSVPWLVDRHTCSTLGNSDEAIAYLGAVLVPEIADPERRAACASLLARTPAARAWEPRLSVLGHAVQGWCYHHLLAPGADPEASLRAWGVREAKVSLPERLALRLGYPIVARMLGRKFSLGSARVLDQRAAHIEAAMAAADAALAKGPYLTGESLSYVDIGFAALAAPLLPESLLFADPSPYAGGRFASFDGAVAGREVPEPIRAMEAAFAARPSGQHVLRLFAEHRAPASAAVASGG